MIGREQGDRVEGRVVVAFFRRRSRERLVPMTRTHRGTLEIHFLSLLDRIAATKHMTQLSLDFDAATTYQASKKLGISQIVSYDEDFGNLPSLERITPKQALNSKPEV